MYNLYDFPMLVIDEQFKQSVSVKFLKGSSVHSKKSLS